MKKIILILLALSPAFVSAQTKTSVNFDHELSWRQVKEKARAEHKYIFVDVFATWCGPCKMMDRDVYVKDSVARLMDGPFISVRLQMDSTKYDDEYVKSWYTDSRIFQRDYKFAGYPSFLFFTPEGQMILQDIGYKSVADFIQMVNLALEPKRAQFAAILAQYKQGKKDYGTMGDLAVYARDVVKEKELAYTIAADYKTNDLDKLSATELCTKPCLDLIRQFSGLVSVKDHFFQLFYDDPVKVDSVFGQQGFANAQVVGAIFRAELDTRFMKNGKPAVKHPDLPAIFSLIKKKYPKIDLHQPLVDWEIFYYRVGNDWSNYAKSKEAEFKRHPPIDGMSAYMSLNVSGAWDMFLNCSDHVVLRSYGLKWIDMAIAMEADDQKAAYWDTKANILYKLGEKKAAIVLEKQAMEKDSAHDPDIIATYQKMIKNEPTWPQNHD
jgi:thioredoxin-related protein